MKRKRRLLTNDVYKWKARLNLHGGQQEHGVNYWETYAPVVTWAAIRLVMILVLMYKWYTVQIDFVLAYPQGDVECDLFMKIPKGFEVKRVRHTYLSL
jgi:Reverse transcriptase (RNA-dependent DNA polymerase)